MKARILIPDSSNRWQVGEIGEVLPKDYEKYDVMLQLKGTVEVSGIQVLRIFYFYENEVEFVGK